MQWSLQEKKIPPLQSVMWQYADVLTFTGKEKTKNADRPALPKLSHSPVIAALEKLGLKKFSFE